MNRRTFLCGLTLGALAAPPAAEAQPLRIGFLHQGSPDPPPIMDAFRKGLSETGITEGRDVIIEHRWADGQYDRLPALAARLVDDRPAVIAADFLPASLAAKAATQTIPVVFLSGSDPIASGLVSSLSRPTGNVTGIAFMFTRLGAKNLELLRELLPKAAAKALGLTIPPSLLTRADQVIE